MGTKKQKHEKMTQLVIDWNNPLITYTKSQRAKTIAAISEDIQTVFQLMAKKSHGAGGLSQCRSILKCDASDNH